MRPEMGCIPENTGAAGPEPLGPSEPVTGGPAPVRENSVRIQHGRCAKETGAENENCKTLDSALKCGPIRLLRVLYSGKLIFLVMNLSRPSIQ